MKNTSHQVETNIEKCKLLWEEFSPKQSLFDLWEFRLPFCEIFQHQPYFILLKNDQENIGLLPLQYEPENNQYTWFGNVEGWLQEDNSFWIKNPIDLSAILSFCPSPVCLNSIIAEKIAGFIPAEKKDNFQPDDSKYILNISDIKTFDDYLMTIKKNRRHSIRKEYKKINAKQPEIIINNFADISKMADISLQRFRQKFDNNNPSSELSIWEDKHYLEVFKKIVENPTKSWQIKTISIKISEQTVAVDLIAIYNGCYYALMGGYDVEACPGIGNYLNILEIKDAIELGLKEIDFLQCSCQWKDKWFQTKDLLKYTSQ